MPPKRECLPCKEREEYVRHIQMTRCSSYTANCANRYIDEFHCFCRDRDTTFVINKTTARAVRGYAHHLYLTSSKRGTAATKLSALIAFFDWLFRNGPDKNPAKGFAAEGLLDAIHAKEQRPSMAKD